MHGRGRGRGRGREWMRERGAGNKRHQDGTDQI